MFLYINLMLILISIFLLLKLYEKIKIYYCWKGIPWRIHVNGTRGKSTMVRLLKEGLEAGGYRVMGKISGEYPELLMGNKRMPLKRWAPPSIREQVKALKKARDARVQVFIAECMAIDPELQKASERIINSQIGVITGIGPDHIDVLGSTRSEITAGLSQFIPYGGRLFGPDNLVEKLASEARARKTTIIPARSLEEGEKEDFSFQHFSGLAAIALEVCSALGVPRDKALPAIKAELKKSNIVFSFGGGVVVNAFSANDPVSTRNIWQDARQIAGQKEGLIGIFNNRNDRNFRLKTFAPLFRELPFSRLIVIGDYHLNLKKMAAPDLPLEIKTGGRYREVQRELGNLQGDNMILCFGNFHGPAEKILQWFRQEVK